jgi:HD-GYP domain-containing protein (c-di-GMP phosphodiesterase class II)
VQLENLANVTPGSVLGDTVFGTSGQPLLYAGVTLTQQYLDDLKALGISALYIRRPDTVDIELPHPISPETRGRAMRHLTQAFAAVTEACEGLRQASVETIQSHLQSERFASTVRSAGAAESIGALCADLDSFLEQLMNREVLAGLNSIKAHDTYTFQHSIDVTIMAVVLGRRLAWDRHRLKSFAIGCMLHDIGKIFIDPAILNKPSRLSDDEFARVKSHPTLGYSVIRAIAPGLGPLCPLVAYQHHEKQDGSGYPRGLRGNNLLGQHAPPSMIHDFGAVCAVADVYDAVASHRPYRQAMPADRVIKLICGMSKTHLNRIAVDVFSTAVAPFPVCTPVRVINGKYSAYEGIISKVHEHQLARPRVRLLRDPSGLQMNPVEIDLRLESDTHIESASLQPATAAAPRHSAHAA